MLSNLKLSIVFATDNVPNNIAPFSTCTHVLHVLLSLNPFCQQPADAESSDQISCIKVIFFLCFVINGLYIILNSNEPRSKLAINNSTAYSKYSTCNNLFYRVPRDAGIGKISCFHSTNNGGR